MLLLAGLVAGGVVEVRGGVGEALKPRMLCADSKIARVARYMHQ